MTDLRCIENHRETEDFGWRDALVGVIGLIAVLGVFWVFLSVFPFGVQTVDEFIEVEFGQPGLKHHVVYVNEAAR